MSAKTSVTCCPDCAQFTSHSGGNLCAAGTVSDTPWPLDGILTTGAHATRKSSNRVLNECSTWPGCSISFTSDDWKMFPAWPSNVRIGNLTATSGSGGESMVRKSSWMSPGRSENRGCGTASTVLTGHIASLRADTGGCYVRFCQDTAERMTSLRCGPVESADCSKYSGDELAQLLAKWRTPIEINPSSNLLIGRLQYPLEQPLFFLDPLDREEQRGLALTLSADDPVCFATSLAGRIRIRVGRLGDWRWGAPGLCPRMAGACGSGRAACGILSSEFKMECLKRTRFKSMC